MVQLLAAILFFYVFGLGAVFLTGYMAVLIVRFFREAGHEGRKP